MGINRKFLMQQTYSVLFSITNKLQRLGNSHFDGLTSRQFMTMLAIAHLSKEETTLNNIASKLGSTKQSARQILSNLEQKGYIITISNDKDKRAKNSIITDLGNKIMEEYYNVGDVFLKTMFADFSTEELELLWNLLKRLYQFDGEELNGYENEMGRKS